MKRKRHTPQEIIAKLREPQVDLNRGTANTQEIAIEPEFVVRESTGPAPSRIRRSAEQSTLSLQAGGSPSD